MLLADVHPSLGTEKQQCPEHTQPIPVEIRRGSHGPGPHQRLEVGTPSCGSPVVEEVVQRRGGFRQFLTVGQAGHLAGSLLVADPFRARPTSLSVPLLFQLRGDGLQLPDQFRQGHWALQRWWGRGSSGQVTLGMPGQTPGALVQALAVCLQRILLGGILHGEGVLLQQLGFERQQYSCGQEGCTAVGQILLVAAAVDGHQARLFNA